MRFRETARVFEFVDGDLCACRGARRGVECDVGAYSVDVGATGDELASLSAEIVPPYE